MKSSHRLIIVLSCLLGVMQAQNATTATAKTSYCDGATASPPSAEISRGRLVHSVNPKYPKKARREKIQGSVTLSATIAKDGSVQDIKVKYGDPALTDAAVEAVTQWRYEPYLIQGLPVEVQTEIIVNFQLEGVSQKASIPQEGAASGNTSAVATVPAQNDSAEPTSIYAVGGDVKAPRKIYGSDPGYSDKARKAKIQGNVTLAVVITAEGGVSGVEICKSLEPSLDWNAVETVRTWRFEPAAKDGKPVATHVSVDVAFRLY
jgi:TonB family protein